MSIEEQATGIQNAHGYKDHARGLGYEHIEVLDWTSSAGDWSFIVSKDGDAWRILTQTNNWPRPGFSYQLDDREWFGTAKQVINFIYESEF